MKNFKIIESLNKTIFDECYKRFEETKEENTKIISFFRNKTYDKGIEYIQYMKQSMVLPSKKEYIDPAADSSMDSDNETIHVPVKPNIVLITHLIKEILEGKPQSNAIDPATGLSMSTGMEISGYTIYHMLHTDIESYKGTQLL